MASAERPIFVLNFEPIRKPLMAAMIRGDRDQVIELVTRHFGFRPSQEFSRSPLVKYAMRQGLDESEATEAVQDALLVVRDAQYRRDSPIHVVGWFVSILKNAIRNKRSAQRATTKPTARNTEYAELDSAVFADPTGGSDPSLLSELRGIGHRLAAFARSELDALAEPHVVALGTHASWILQAAYPAERPVHDALPDALSALRAFGHRGVLPSSETIDDPVGRRARRSDLVLWMGELLGLKTAAVLDCAPEFEKPNRISVRRKEWTQRLRDWWATAERGHERSGR